MNSPIVAATGVRGLKFYVSRIGATIGTLGIRIADGSGTFPTLLAT